MFTLLRLGIILLLGARIILPSFFSIEIDFTLTATAAALFLALIYQRRLCVPYPFFCLSSIFILILRLAKSNFIAFNFFLNLLFCLIIFILSYNFLSHKEIKVLIYISIPLALYAILQHFILLKLIKPDPGLISFHHIKHIVTTKRAFANFISPNLFASYLLIMLPLAICSYHYIAKNIYYPILFLLSFSLLFTKSLGALLVFAISLCSIIFFISKKNLLYKICKIFIFLMLLSLIITMIQRRRFFFDPNNLYFNPFYHRIAFWKTSLRIIKEHPLAGVGIGNFPHFYLKYKPKGANDTIFAHNIFLQFWNDAGILGLIWVLSLYYLFSHLIVNVYRIKSKNYLLKLSFAWAGINFLIHNLIDISFYIQQVSFLFWLIWGLLLKQKNFNKK